MAESRYFGCFYSCVCGLWLAMHSATHVGTPSIRTVRLGPAVKAEVAKMNEGGGHPHEPRRLGTECLRVDSASRAPKLSKFVTLHKFVAKQATQT